MLIRVYCRLYLALSLVTIGRDRLCIADLIDSLHMYEYMQYGELQAVCNVRMCMSNFVSLHAGEIYVLVTTNVSNTTPKGSLILLVDPNE